MAVNVKKERDIFLVYNSWRKVLKKLQTDTQRWLMMDAIWEYSISGNEPEEWEDPVLDIIWDLIVPLLEKQRINFENGVKGGKHGKKGGRPPKTPEETPEKPRRNPQITPEKPPNNPPKTPYKEKDIDKEKEKETDKEKKSTADELKFRQLKNFVKYRNRARNDTAWITGVCREFEKKRMTAKDVLRLLDEFGLIQLTNRHPGWTTEQDFVKHFKNWIRVKYPERIREPAPVVEGYDFSKRGYR